MIVSITLTRESDRSCAISFSSPSWRIRSSIPLCERSSVLIRLSFATHCPAVRIIAGRRLGPTTTMPTMRMIRISPKPRPNTRAR